VPASSVQRNDRSIRSVVSRSLVMALSMRSTAASSSLPRGRELADNHYSAPAAEQGA